MDEADRLLEGKGNFDEQVNFRFLTFSTVNSNISYLQQLKRIFEELPKNKQTLLFSATITDTLKKLQEVALNNVTFPEWFLILISIITTTTTIYSY